MLTNEVHVWLTNPADVQEPSLLAAYHALMTTAIEHGLHVLMFSDIHGSKRMKWTPDGTITDPADDATGAVLVDSTPSPSQDDLDVLRAWLSTGGTAAAPTITTHVKVKDLSANAGQTLRFYFSYGTAQYFTIASRDVDGTESYDLEQSGTTGNTELKAITGKFDNATSTITATFSVADFNTTAKPAKPLAVGGSLGGLQVLSQRNTGVITATSDTASGLCAYVVGTAPVAAPPTPSPSASGSTFWPAKASRINNADCVLPSGKVTAVRVHLLAELPTTPTGKPDHGALVQQARIAEDALVRAVALD